MPLLSRPAPTPPAPSAVRELDGRPDPGERFLEVRRATRQLIEGLSPEDCQVQSMPDASPAKWHLAHTTWFFETFVLLEADLGYRAFHPRYGYLFNSYYDAVGARHARPERGLLTRPSLEEVLQYRAAVDEAVVRALAAGRLDRRFADLVELGLHHEQQHQELLLTDLKHAFSKNPLLPAYRAGELPEVASPGPMRFVRVEGGEHRVGARGRGFRFDNEEPCHRVLLEPFEVAERPVTNGEYLEFVRAGGYRRPELWLSDGWAELDRERRELPLYWVEREGQSLEFTLRGLSPLDLDAPVCHLSYYEADAFASFAGARLPTELEWEVAARRFDSAPRGSLLECGRLHPGSSEARQGARDFLGGVWEWTRSAYSPYPGYRRAEGALGEYNGKFMCGQLVLRGGSCATPEGHLRVSYRNFFPPGARWQFTGVRLARDLTR